MQKRHADRQLYFNEQSITTQKYVIPFIEKHKPITADSHILEIGCGEGGNIKPFLDLGCQVTGIDINGGQIAIAKEIYSVHPNNRNLTLICEDIYKVTELHNKFDIIIIRDVIEHIPNQELFLPFIKRFLSPHGIIFVAFPPWQNPFGGHQQICNNKLLSHLPWFHLLPRPVYKKVLEWGNVNPGGLLEIKDTGISLERFLSIVHKEKYRIVEEVRDILRHQAGFPADPQYYNDSYDQSSQSIVPGAVNVLYSGSDGSTETRTETLHSIFKTPLMYEPGTKTVYSDVDYMLLAFVIEKITGKGLDVFLKETFWDPMGLTRTTYNPLRNGFAPNDCAATELNGDTRDGYVSFTGARTVTTQGQVHDGKAYFCMAGISGHAGLFSTATELAKLASVMLTGGYGENRYFSRNVMDAFTAPKKENAANWGLGWWREGDNQRCWYFGTQSSPNTIGHQGWTGTLTMIDPSENLVVVYLTNKINSRITDPANVNEFNGNWYTASTLGFVAQLLYQGLQNHGTDPNNAYSALLEDMAESKFALVAEGGSVPATHPLVRSGYAVLEAMAAHANSTHSYMDRRYFNDAITLLDATRDAEELAKLKKIAQKH